MAVVRINPRFRALMSQHGLRCAEDFLELPGVIVSGHPDRNVARVILGTGIDARTAFLKREHQVRWRTRFANALTGHGPVSRSLREANVLERLHRAGVGCPDWIAVGEDHQGRAFLLIDNLAGSAELPELLMQHRNATTAWRARLARRLGEALARLHESGFNQPDLYAKHVYVNPADLSVRFLDWQRSQYRPHQAWKQRCRDLAALDGTLAGDLVSDRERLLCLRTYLRRLRRGRPDLRALARYIRRISKQLQTKRHIRELRQRPQALGTLGIRWLEGEALCVTEEYWTASQGHVPDWWTLVGEAGRWTTRRKQAVVPLPGGRTGLLVASRYCRPFLWLWSVIRGRPWMTPEVRQAGWLFRKQRHGHDAPRLWAFGQRRPRPWRAEAFLLTDLEAPSTGRIG